MKIETLTSLEPTKIAENSIYVISSSKKNMHRLIISKNKKYFQTFVLLLKVKKSVIPFLTLYTFTASFNHICPRNRIKTWWVL
jgi:hypothetical protein